MDDDEIARLLANARTTSERRSAPPARRRSPGRTSVLVDLVRMVPLVVTAVFVLVLLGNATGFL